MKNLRMAFWPIVRPVNAITTGLKGYFSSANPNEKFENTKNTVSLRETMTFSVFNTPEPSFLHIDHIEEFITILPGGKYVTRNDNQGLWRN